MSGDQGDQWNIGIVDLSSLSGQIMVRFHMADLLNPKLDNPITITAST